MEKEEGPPKNHMKTGKGGNGEFLHVTLGRAVKRTRETGNLLNKQPSFIKVLV